MENEEFWKQFKKDFSKPTKRVFIISPQLDKALKEELIRIINDYAV